MITASEENVCKILDIFRSQLSKEFLSIIEGHESWKDRDDEINEHIYPFDELLYTLHWGDQSGTEMIEIVALCNKYECNYFRIINV